jgi:hypothetical protein
MTRSRITGLLLDDDSASSTWKHLDSCPDEYKYSTRTHGQLVIEKPYLALLASTTPANLGRFAGRGGEF